MPMPPATGVAGVPQAPTFDPSLAQQQYSAPPVSAYPYGFAMSGIPAAPAAPAKSSRTTIIVLSVLVALLVGASGVMTTLFVLQKQQTNTANSTITQLSGQVGQLQTANDGLKQDLDKAKADLKDAQDTNDQTQQQKQTLADCLNALDAEFTALNRTQGQVTPAIQKLIDDADTKCTKAEKLL
jgi:Tfp pilus assembly protein PilN